MIDDDVVLPDGYRGVHCECDHLTEFAILQYGNTSCENVTIDATSYLVFAIIYALVLIFASSQLYNAYRFVSGSRKVQLLVHLIIVTVCIFRIIVSVVRYTNDITSLDGITRAILVAVPYTLMFWLYSFIVFSWAGI